ncbi:MAG: glycosyltransferase family 1 protein [Devosia sp.]|nr:glycosyltransferase family 1 protein [Devosia sp.]
MSDTTQGDPGHQAKPKPAKATGIIRKKPSQRNPIDLANDAPAAAPPAAPAGQADAATPAAARQSPRLDAPVAETGVQHPAQRALQGRIDKATPAVITGWVWDPKAPEKRIRLELVEGETQLATFVAGDDRPDLTLAGVGDGRHAFRHELTAGALAKGRHVLQLRCADTGAAMPGSPITIEAAEQARETTFLGSIDKITDSEISGWVTARNEPSRHCVVALKERGRILARAVASRFRADLLGAGIGNGCYAFHLPMPSALLNGEEHLLEIVEENSGFVLNRKPISWRSTAGTARTALTGIGDQRVEPRAEHVTGRPETAAARPVMARRADGDATRPPPPAGRQPAVPGKPETHAAAHVGTRLLFDISDLIYYIGHHPNLTGIQRVQSSIVLSMIEGQVIPETSVIFLSFNAKTRRWNAIPTGFLISLLRDFFLPESQRLVAFPMAEARYGALPDAQPFDGAGVLDDGNPSVLCLLGAAWVQQDYLHRVLDLKRRFGTRFAMTVHDLIPIYARETCDQGTVRVFEEFMRRALRHVDHILAVSENTAKDVRRYLATQHLPVPAITVTGNGSSFAEFLPPDTQPDETTLRDLPKRFVLFVATIEGRKNHQLIFDIWQRMVAEGDDPPHLICVGRLGWRAAASVSLLVETNYLDGRVHLLREISDTDLSVLYSRCLFTVFPTLYEGWGLPVGESLAMGKICVSSNRASVPEVAGDCGVYIDIENIEQSLSVIRGLIRDEAAREKLEAKIRRDYVPLTWRSIAEKVVAACQASANIEWQEPYPYTALPYSTEISFGRMDPDTEAIGELLLAHIVDARLGHFKYDALGQQSLSLGEEIRSHGAWAEPERWGTWVCHSGGDLLFDLAAETSQFYYVFLLVRVSGPLQDQPIRLLANGEKVWEGPIGLRSKNIALRIRKRPAATSRWKLQIGIDVDLTPELRNQIAAMDSRIPTVGLERLIVVPENDLKTRLDVITKILL